MQADVFSPGQLAVGTPLRGWLGWGPACWIVLGLAAAAAAQMPAAPVNVAVVQQRDLATGETFVGTVMPLRTSTVSSAVEGLVDELNVREGQQVNKGDTLAQLRTRQLLIQLDIAQAELKLREQELEESNKSLPKEIEQARARMEAAEALMQFTKKRLERTRRLIQSRTISEDELDEVESAALTAQKRHEENKVALQLAEAVAPVKLRQAQLRVDIQNEEVLRLDDDLVEHTIIAPFDGYVTKEHTEVGQWIAKGDPVVEVVEVHHVDVEVSVLESFLAQVRVGRKTEVTIGALPRQKWSGEVAAIVPQADVRSRSFPVKVRLKNRPGPGGVLLKPGMFARVTLPVSNQPGALLVPKDAVVLGGQRPVVYVVDPLPSRAPPKGSASGGAPSKGGAPPGRSPDGVARMEPVELGQALGELVEVRGSLKPGDRVVVEGNERLPPGSPVIIVNRDRLPSSKPAAKPPK